MSDEKRHGFLARGLMIALAVVIVDQVSKWWIVFDVMIPPKTIPVFPSFNLVMGWNRGVSFGMFNSASPMHQWLLIGLALVVVVVLLVWLKRAESRLIALSLGLIIGGALGNVIDRIHFGAVADFLDFYVGGYHWPAFNVADAGITVGAVILVLDSLLTGDDRNKTGTEESDIEKNDN